MIQLTFFNIFLILIISAVLVFCKKKITSDKVQNILFLAAAIFTIFCHYSSLLYHHFLDDSAFVYLKHNPNLILPIYPCNVVMWSALIYGLCKNKQSKFANFLADYLFWFGIISTLVGMFANVDFIRNPTLADFDITKGIVAHATLLFNVLLLAVFGRVKIHFKRNMLNILISVAMMYVVGLYCNLLFKTIGSDALAYEVNSMFIIHSPFDGVDFLKYPVIAIVAILVYFIVFNICELIAHPKGERWFDKTKNQ